MRDPMSWAVPLYRLFGIQVKLHLLFIIVTLPLFLRNLKDGNGDWLVPFMLTLGLVFPIILLHEYGHSFAARAVGGSSDTILLWPLGGLAYCDVPHTPRANFWCTIWGPLVNVIISAACAGIMLVAGYSPVGAINPFNNPYSTPTYKLGDGRVYTSDYDAHFYKAGTNELVSGGLIRMHDGSLTTVDVPEIRVERALAPTWLPWVWRVCWLSWWLFLFNMLIPAYPMDCGRLLHCFLWARSDYRSATLTCCYVGFGAAAIMFMISIFANETLLLGLSLFIVIECYRTMKADEGEAGVFGYDFSQGYTSLEKDEPKPTIKKPGAFKRWLQARRMRRLKFEHEQQALDETRMDELLDKIARTGKQSLTDEERRFMERVSARYRNRS